VGKIEVPRPSASASLTGRRQKALMSYLHSFTICDKVASGNKASLVNSNLIID
jgi:hypothetical protein